MAAAARATGVHVAGPARAAGRQRTARARPRATLRAAADGGGDGAAASDEEERQRALEAADAAEDVTVEGNQVVKDSVRDLRALQASEREVLNKVRSGGARTWAGTRLVER